MNHRLLPFAALARLSRLTAMIGTSLLMLCATAQGEQAHGADSQRLDDAIRHQVELLETRGYDPGLLVDLGNLLVLADRTEEAESVYRRALEDGSFTIDAAYNLALLLQETGRNEEALELHSQVVEAAPSKAWSHYQIGRIHESRGKKSLALEAYIQAFSIDPELGFPDVNPHVIENGLATEALLRSNATVLQNESAPRSYADGRRIALLLATPKPDESQAVDDDAEPAEPPQASESLTLPSSGPAPTKTTYRSSERDPSETVIPDSADPSELPESATTLGPDDLRDLGRANRAEPPVETGTTARSQTRGGSAAVRTVPPPPPPRRSDPGTDAQVSPQTSPNVTPPPAGGSRFRPGRRSSAQLDLELLPSHTSRAAQTTETAP